MDTPRFCKVGDRPVKAILEDDGFGVLSSIGRQATLS